MDSLLLSENWRPLIPPNYTEKHVVSALLARRSLSLVIVMGEIINFQFADYITSPLGWDPLGGELVGLLIPPTRDKKRTTSVLANKGSVSWESLEEYVFLQFNLFTFRRVFPLISFIASFWPDVINSIKMVDHTEASNWWNFFLSIMFR